MYFDYSQCKQKGHACRQAGFALPLILIGILLLVGVGGGAYFIGRQSLSPSQTPTQKACTEEAKQCPDGLYVSRVGPNCEFAECPSPSATPFDETANWKTYTNSKVGFILKYPDSTILVGGNRGDEYIGFSLAPKELGHAPGIINLEVISDLNKLPENNEYTVASKEIRYNTTTLYLSADAGWGGQPVATEEDKQYIVRIFNQIIDTITFIDE